MLIEVSIIVAGIILVVVLADQVIRNSIDIAHHLNLSGAFVGLTILSIGTSIPEIMTHIMGSIAIVENPARLDALSGLLIGTNIGSDIFHHNRADDADQRAVFETSMETGERDRHDLRAGLDGQPEGAGMHPGGRQRRRLTLALRADHDVRAAA